MKITEVRVIVTCPDRNYVAVKIMTDQPGLYGVGDATLNGRELSVAAIITEHIAPLLIGRDPGQIEDIWQTLYRGSYWRGGPVQMTALAGIDIALWDIKGKAAGMPVYSLLGGRTRVGALAYTHASGRDFKETEDRVHGAIAKGFKVVRAQVAIPGSVGTYGVGGGGSAASVLSEHPGDLHGDGGRMPTVEKWEPSPYLRTIPALFDHLRAAVGFEVELFHDVHERLTPIQAARLARDLEPHRILFLEDPLRPEHLQSFRLMREHSVTPLGMGELLHSRWDCLQLLTEQLIDYIRCDIGHAGGITEARKIAAVAETFHVQTAWHGPGDIGPATHAANVHIDISVPNFGVQEMVFFGDAVNEVFPGAPVFRDGYLNVSDTPGLGTDINEEAAKKYPYQRAYLPVTRRADGSVLDW